MVQIHLIEFVCLRHLLAIRVLCNWRGNQCLLCTSLLIFLFFIVVVNVIIERYSFTARSKRRYKNGRICKHFSYFDGYFDSTLYKF